MKFSEQLTDRDHGGGLDAAIAAFGGAWDTWLDLSTGINPNPYPIGTFSPRDWSALPDRAAQQALEHAARRFWDVPEDAAVLPVPGLSAAIARIPALAEAGRVQIPGPTYNEHAAAFRFHGWEIAETGPAAAQVIVHPNNPDGRLWSAAEAQAPLQVIDESFCDICPDRSLIALADRPGTMVLKSFGKFWGLAGLRLGFVIARPDLIARLGALMGPWAVSGPALAVGTRALSDTVWADDTRQRLQRDAARLDSLATAKGARVVGGTDLFRLYEVDDAQACQDRLARHHIWSRIFPYSRTWLRLGLPPATGWDRVGAAL